MKTIYVRNVDERTHIMLKKAAKERDISMSELVRQLMDGYAMRTEVENLDQKYRAFATDLLALQRAEQENLQRLVTRCERIFAKLEGLIDEGSEQY